MSISECTCRVIKCYKMNFRECKIYLYDCISFRDTNIYLIGVIETYKKLIFTDYTWSYD